MGRSHRKQRGLIQAEAVRAECQDWLQVYTNTLILASDIILAPRKESEQEGPHEITLDASRILKAAVWNLRHSFPFSTKLRPYRVISGR